MKSRWTTYLLLAAVAAVWGLVAWRIFAPARNAAPVAVPTREVEPVAATTADTLRLDYPDPFLKGVVRPQPAAPRPVVRRLPPAKKTTAKPRERVRIVHLATVAAGGQALHILTIGKRQHELRAGETSDGWRLARVDGDSLYLEREGTIHGVKRCE